MTAVCAPPARQPDAPSRATFSISPLAAPAVNRCGASGKCGKDAAEWMPARNMCWFAARVVAVRQKYGLSVDRREAEALEAVLSKCASTAMVFHAGASAVPADADNTPAPTATDALALWDDNDNGRITCKEARRHGIAPVGRDHPAYPFMHDGDNDGVVCE